MARRALYDAAHLLPVAVVAGLVAGAPDYGARIEGVLFPVAKMTITGQTRNAQFACFVTDYDRLRPARINAVDAYAIVEHDGDVVRVDMSPLFVSSTGRLRTFSQRMLHKTAQFRTSFRVCFDLTRTEIPEDAAFSLHMTYIYSMPHGLWKIPYRVPEVEFKPYSGPNRPGACQDPKAPPK